MMLRSRHWLSSVVRHDKGVGEALAEISQLIRRYADAGSPIRDSTSQASSRQLEVSLFRPSVTLFLPVVVAFGAAGGAYALATPDADLSRWADLTVKTAVPMFVLGISLVGLTRSLSEAGRFTAEYLNDACRMPLFCCLTFLAALIACSDCMVHGHAASSRSHGVCCRCLGRCNDSVSLDAGFCYTPNHALLDAP